MSEQTYRFDNIKDQEKPKLKAVIDDSPAVSDDILIRYPTFANFSFGSIVTEKEFFDDFCRNGIFSAKLAAVSGGLVHLALIPLDRLSSPSNFNMALLARAGIIIPLCLLAFVLISQYQKFAARWLQEIVCVPWMATGLLVNYLIYSTPPSEVAYGSYFGGLMLLNFWACGLGRILFKYATFLCVSNSILFYIVTIVLQSGFKSKWGSQELALFMNGFMWYTASLFAFLFISRLLELFARREYYNNLYMSLKNNELKKAKEEIASKNAEIIQKQSEMVQIAKFSALGEMAGGVAHEINNPLAIITANSELILKYASNPEKLTRCTDAISRASIRATKIVSGLLNFSEYSGTESEQKLSLQELIESVISFSKAKLTAKGIEIHLAPIPVVDILCHKNSIIQTILALINNSVDVLKDIAKPELFIEFNDLEEKIEIKCRDNGPGIAEENISKIMTPFFTTKPVGSGVGLGLSVARGIVEKHGGKLSFKNTNPGVEFTIHLPKCLATPKPSA